VEVIWPLWVVVERGHIVAAHYRPHSLFWHVARKINAEHDVG